MPVSLAENFHLSTNYEFAMFLKTANLQMQGLQVDTMRSICEEVFCTGTKMTAAELLSKIFSDEAHL